MPGVCWCVDGRERQDRVCTQASVHGRVLARGSSAAARLVLLSDALSLGQLPVEAREVVSPSPAPLPAHRPSLAQHAVTQVPSSLPPTASATLLPTASPMLCLTVLPTSPPLSPKLPLYLTAPDILRKRVPLSFCVHDPEPAGGASHVMFCLVLFASVPFKFAHLHPPQPASVTT